MQFHNLKWCLTSVVLDSLALARLFIPSPQGPSSLFQGYPLNPLPSALSLSERLAGRCPRLVSSCSPNRWRMVAGERTLRVVKCADMFRAPLLRSITPAGLFWDSWLLGKSVWLDVTWLIVPTDTVNSSSVEVGTGESSHCFHCASS